MGNNRTKKRKSSGSQITSARNKFMCFACLDGDLDLTEFEMFQHKDLEVSLCDTCYDTHGAEKWHSAGDWQLRDENDKCQFCEICGEGGTLLPCDKCSLSYCTSCLKYWLGEEKLQLILDDDTFEFNCFLCLKNGGSKEKLDSKFPEYKKFRDATNRYGNFQASVRSQQIEEDIKEDLKSVKKVKRFKCFSCFDVKDFTAKTKLKTHAKFKTVTCDDCHQQLTQDDWTYTSEGKSEYCVLTGTDQGGDEIFVCDTEGCENVFCEMILKHWMTKSEFARIMEDEDAEFYCFTCKPDQGNYKKFLKETKQYLDAFEDDDFTPGEDTERRIRQKEELKKQKQKEREESKSSSSSPKRASSRKRAIQEEDLSSDDEVSAPKTRNININLKEDDSDIESDPEIDYVNMNGDSLDKEEVPTEKETAAYFVSRIQSGAFNKKYHATKAYQKILKFAKNLK